MTRGSHPKGTNSTEDGHKFSSLLEQRVYNGLKAASDFHPFKIEYESERIPYIVEKNYIPDFIITRSDGSKIYIESKGRFPLEDRQKMLAVKEQHPDKTFALLFQKDLPIYKGSSTLYSDWAESQDFLYAINYIPMEWLVDAEKFEQLKTKRINLELIWTTKPRLDP